ncbi:hypothetical protein [Phenylobacterium sp.]|uniref:hypothetical protein n=1 Tax=Phenylobacterium sp. TaxID=1871053 RepID=UPI00273149F6|nr:hypothetical protein [Phenylobacterium sp.]MDP1617912.1 hypothetical protein [Phenylobacterium sp.]
MQRYHIVRWIDQIPFAHERSVQNDDQAIGCATETGLRHLEQWGESAAGMAPHIHVYKSEEGARVVRFSVETFVASLLPLRKDGELGYALNYPAAQGRQPNKRDLEI